MTNYLALLLAFCVFIIGYNVDAQNRIELIDLKLDELAQEIPTLEERVQLSVNGASIQEVLRAIGTTHKLNLGIDPSINLKIHNNFTNASVKDVLIFLCKEFFLDISITGNIINLKPYLEPKAVPKAKEVEVAYNDSTRTLDIDLQNDTLGQVIKKIIKLSGINIVLSPQVPVQLVNIYMRDVSIESALDKIAFATGLEVVKESDGVYLFENVIAEPRINANATETRTMGRGRASRSDNGIDFKIGDGQRFSVAGDNVALSNLVDYVSKQLGIPYFLFGPLPGTATLFFENVTYDEFLERVLKGSSLSHIIADGIYIIGDRNSEVLRQSELVRLQNRTINQIRDLIPAEVKKEIEISEYRELNGLIISGSRPRVKEVKDFIMQLDQVVPLITIDVIIADININRSTQTGLTFGIGSDVIPSKISANGGIDIALSGNSLNNLINSFNGFGSINLGKVTPDFYLTLKALENDGIIKTRSTPRLSTLNGNVANLSIGEMTYYLEITNNLIGSQNPAVTTSQLFKPVSADLSVTINPIVSGDDQVTLEIEVNQTDFTNKRITDTAPPGTTSRKFKSIIRVRNEEMVILGGLESNRNERSGSGFPFLNRIPLLKYLFGSRTSIKAKSKLSILIKPTITYT